MAANLPRLDPQSDSVDIQNTTFTLDGVARFFCNTWDEATGQMDPDVTSQQIGRPFDFVVIGSGMYGAYCAQLLYRMGESRELRILVLEAGPVLITEHIQNLSRIGYDVGKMVQEVHWSSNIDNEKNAQTRDDGYSPHYICVGGKSVFWGGWSPRLTAADLSQPKWPAEVVDYLDGNYARLEGETGVKPDTDFIKGPLATALRDRTEAILSSIPNLDPGFPIDPPLAVQGDSPASGLFSFDKFSSLPLLVDAIRDDSSKRGDSDRQLLLVPRARVIRIETSNGVCRQIVASVNGEIRRLDLAPSCQVALGLTTMNSTRLALESFPKTEERKDEVMGRNLMTHLRGNFTVRIKRAGFGVQLPDVLTVGAVHVQGAHNDRRFHFQVYAAANVTPSAEEFLYRMIPSLDDLDRILSSQNNEWITVTVRTVGEMVGDTGPIHAPDKSWMDLSPFVRDVFGDFSVPSGFVNLTPTEGDLDLWNRMDQAAFDYVLKLAGGAGNIQYFYRKKGDPKEDWHDDLPDIHAFRDGLGTTFHEAGTLWMGEDPASSVTDASGRFHHVANAACVDQSLFPAVGSANPVLTGLTITRKVTSDLLERFRSEPEPVIEPDFTPLFDGSLANWAAAAGGASHFHVLSGLPILEAGLYNEDVALGILGYTPGTFKNFTLRLDWKAFSITANSGILLRMPDPAGTLDDAFYAQTIEVQIDERGFDFQSGRYGQELHKTGAIYKALPARRWAARSLSPFNHPGYWNEFEITVQDNHISVRLNGMIVSDGDLPAGKLAEGFIGLQCHTQVVQFRNIRIKKL